jgi:hypothetical protein
MQARGQIRPALRTRERDGIAHHFRRGIKGVFRAAITLDFHSGQGLGFSNTTFVDSGSATGDTDGDDFMLPSQNKNVPPYL